MATITFDTPEFVEKPDPGEHPKAEAKALQEAFGTAKVATQRDIERIESQLRAVKTGINGKMTLIQ